MIAQRLNSQTIAQNGEIQKQLNNTPNRNYKNYRSCSTQDLGPEANNGYSGPRS